MDCKAMNLYTNSMSTDELAACLCVKEVSNSCSSPYIGRYVSLLSEPSFSHRARQENPFLTPVQQIAKQVVELRPASASVVATRPSSTLSCHPSHPSNKKSVSNTLLTRREINRQPDGRSLAAARPPSRTNSSHRAAIRTLCPQPDSHPQDYSTIRIVSRLSGASDRALRPSTTTTAPYLLAPGGQYVSQLIISRSPSQLNRPSTGSASRATPFPPASSSMSASNSTTSCASHISHTSHNSAVPLTTLENEELDARERELELELQRIQMERQARTASRMSSQSGRAASSTARLQKELADHANSLLLDLPIGPTTSAGIVEDNAPVRATTESRDVHTNDPLIKSLTALSRSSSRNVFLESYVAEETVRRCLQRSTMAGSQALGSCSCDDVCSSQASVLTAVHLGQTNVDDQSSPQIAAHALKKLISELLQHPQAASPTVSSSQGSVQQSAESRSESSSPYPNTYSARDYVTHEDILSVFDPDDSLNFNRFKHLAKKFYGRIGKGKLWSVAKEIDLIDNVDDKIDHLYSFLFNR